MTEEEETPLMRMPRNFEEALEQFDNELKEREAWSDYTKAMSEYAAACVGLVERLAEGDCDEMTATIVAEAMQLVSRKPVKPEEPE